jgi:hypothetical protein
MLVLVTDRADYSSGRRRALVGVSALVRALVVLPVPLDVGLVGGGGPKA